MSRYDDILKRNEQLIDNVYEMNEEITDLAYENEELTKVMNSFESFIKNETLCDNFLVKDDLTEDYNLNGIEVKLDVERK